MAIAQYEEQQGQCAFSKMTLPIDKMSHDRILDSIGHVPGNVQLIHPLFLEIFLDQNKVELRADVRQRHEEELVRLLNLKEMMSMV